MRISNDWLKQANSRNYHHFFPRAYLRDNAVEDGLANSVLNVTIVDDYLNKRRIRAKAPSQYIREFEKENPAISDHMKTHLIDDLDDFGVRSDDYERFLEMRAARVSAELQRRVILSAGHDSGQQPIKTDDLEEEPASFE